MNKSILLTSLLFIFIANAMADTPEQAIDKCMIQKLKTAALTETVGELKKACENSIAIEKSTEHNKLESFFKEIEFSKNLAIEPYLMRPYVMTPHLMNYFLPVSYSNNVNKEVYDIIDGWPDNLQDTEVKYQLSFRVPLLTESLFTQGDGIAFAFTIKSWWQLYARDISRPFRETNYQPELFYYTPLSWQPFQGNTAFVFGFEHQSNGYTSTLSRSWNRLYANLVYAKDDYVISLRPWWRIPEGNKITTATEPGDDNPDIEDYMGHFELAMTYKWDDLNMYLKGRENFKTHKGYAEIGLTFPIYERLKAYIQYTNGYGESMIDYNHNQQTIGIGFALTDYFQN